VVFLKTGRVFRDTPDFTEGDMNKLVQFVKESYAELRKVVWPSRDDVVSSIKVVIISTIIIAAALGLVDVLLLFGIRAIF
jgi:preprotein translocase subunit SecE